MEQITREEVIELLRNFQQRMAAKRGMCDEHDGALWDNAESVIAALQAAVPEGCSLIPLDPRNGTPLITNEMKKIHIGEYEFAFPSTDEDGEEILQSVTVPWDLCKAIYKAMAQTAMLTAAPQPAATEVPEGQAIRLLARVQGWWQNTDGDMPASLEQDIAALLTASPAPDQHPDDVAVDSFAAAMKTKLTQKRNEGRGGWDDKEQCSQEFLSELLREHVKKGDPVDVGNLAMMLHQRGENTLPAPDHAAEADVCQNCETALPEGCGGIFAHTGTACRYGENQQEEAER